MPTSATMYVCTCGSAAAKDAKRAVRSGERDIDKEIRNLERNEKSLVAEIKKTAKGGNQVLIPSKVRFANGQINSERTRRRCGGNGNAAESQS